MRVSRLLPLTAVAVLLFFVAGCKSKVKPGKPGGPTGVIRYAADGTIREYELGTRQIADVRAGRDPSHSAATGEDVWLEEHDKHCGKDADERCLMVAGTDGKASIVVRGCKACELPSLNPAGDTFAYAGYCTEKMCGRSSSHATFIRNRKGKLLHFFPSLGNPVWAPDGKLVLAGDSLQGRTGLFLSLDLKSEARLDTDLADPKELAVSPDGKWIAFKQSGADGQIYLIGFDGQPHPPKKITDVAPHTASWPVFSPDGKFIAFEDKERSWADGVVSIVPVSGGSATPLADTKGKPVTAGGRLLWR